PAAPPASIPSRPSPPNRPPGSRGSRGSGLQTDTSRCQGGARSRGQVCKRTLPGVRSAIGAYTSLDSRRTSRDLAPDTRLFADLTPGSGTFADLTPDRPGLPGRGRSPDWRTFVRRTGGRAVTPCAAPALPNQHKSTGFYRLADQLGGGERLALWTRTPYTPQPAHAPIPAQRSGPGVPALRWVCTANEAYEATCASSDDWHQPGDPRPARRDRSHRAFGRQGSDHRRERRRQGSRRQ